ncbi:MAG TPA: 2-amino-4-hydroxy-6-hydroxymethyldihydropteridine diphosphokinase [Steroidobacteraceae bacterium]|jgi:2-amino-4-hydroxy-6-hydroxymethyldihydropteridine diphosphokinase
MPRVFVAAGSNVEPEKNLVLATRELQRSFPDIRFSPWYRNKAVGFEGADFINYVAGFTTDLTVHEVVARLRAIEELCGRPRGAPKYEPRSMDLDILLYGDLICEEPGLKLPRPDLVRRPFMLGPMADVAPDVVHPTLHLTMAELWRGFDQAAHAMVRVAPPPGVHLEPPGSGR